MRIFDAVTAFFQVLRYGAEHEDDRAADRFAGDSEGSRTPTIKDANIYLYKAENGMVVEVNTFSYSSTYKDESGPTLLFVPTDEMNTLGDAIMRVLVINRLKNK
jgi:hypothetical protein